MKKFLAVFTVDADRMAAFQQQPDAQQRSQEGLRAWHAWMEAHRDAIVQAGGPLSRTLEVSAQGIVETCNPMGGYLVLQAASQQAAAALFIDHPSFTIFPGRGVEVMEVLPMPGRPEGAP